MHLVPSRAACLSLRSEFKYFRVSITEMAYNEIPNFGLNTGPVVAVAAGPLPAPMFTGSWQ